jgi:hypothetical protein
MSEPSDLTREALFDRTLPDSWAPLVASVSELGALAAEQAASGDDAARRERAAALRSVIVAAAADKVQASPGVLAWGSPEARRWFTEGVLLWTHFADASGRVRIDMLGSSELRRFPIDLPADPAA